MINELKKFIREETGNLEILDAKIRQFNPFEVLGVTGTEIRHSNFWAWLMDPNGSHGAGHFFIRRLISILEMDNPELEIRLNLFDFHDLVVRREYMNIDILVSSESMKWYLLIENKVWAGRSGKNQLLKYQEVAESLFGEAEEWTPSLEYLTPFQNDLTEAEVEKKYIHIQLWQLLDIVKELLELPGISPEVRQFCNYYHAMAEKNIYQKGEEAKIVQDIYFRHRSALDFIFAHKPILFSKEFIQDIHNYFSDKQNGYENLSPKDPKLVRILPKRTREYFRYPSFSFPECGDTLFAIEFFVWEREIKVKFCFGKIWNQDRTEELQAVKGELFNTMKNFDSIKGSYRKANNPTMGYPAIAWFPFMKLEDWSGEGTKMAVFEKKFQEFEQKVLNRWTEEVLEKIQKPLHA